MEKYVRFGKLLSEESRSSEKLIFDFGEIEEQIFPQFSVNNALSSYEYFHSDGIEARPQLAKYFGKTEIFLGRYESELISKIIDSEDSILLIKGDVGSGKSCTLNYIKRLFEDSPIPDLPEKKRHVIYVNYNVDDFSNNEIEAKSKIQEDLSNRLSLLIEKSNLINEFEEFHHFWPYMFEKNECQNHSNQTFSLLERLLRNKAKDVEETISNLDLIEYRRVKRQLIRNPSSSLFYFYYLAEYIIQTRYLGKRDSIILILDNIDSKKPQIQSAFVSTLENFEELTGPKFIIPIRKETLGSTHFNDFSRIPNTIDQQSINAFNLIKQRIDNFLKNPENYRTKSIEDNTFTFLVDYFSYLARLMGDTSTQKKKFEEFINNISGGSLRLAIQIADGILYVDDELYRRFQNKNLKLYDVCRSMIRRGRHIVMKIDSKELKYHPVNNIFDISEIESPTTLLLKLRILRYLQIIEQKKQMPSSEQMNGHIRLTELANEMKKFGFQNYSHIKPAINDLIRIHRHLIASNDIDAFTTDDEFAYASEARIWITRLGIGYLTLVEEFSFLCIMMHNAIIKASEFRSSYDVSKTNELLKASLDFLKYLFSMDIKEIDNYISNPKSTTAEYLDLYGPYTLTWPILKENYRTAKNIIKRRVRNIDSPNSEEYIELEDLNNSYDDFINNVKETLRRKLNSRVSLPDEYLDDDMES